MLLTSVDRVDSYRSIDYQHKIDFPVQGASDSASAIFSYESKANLRYSLDGGDTYSEISKLDLQEISNPSLLYKRTSQRWRHPEGRFPEIKSIIITSVNHENQLITLPKVLTYFDKEISKLPLVSITVAESDLFSEDRGITVPGFGAWSDTAFYREWWNRPANYGGRGMTWERSAQIKYFEAGELKIDQACGLRISGNATRSFAQKSLRFNARNQYGDDNFDFKFWSDGQKKPESFLLRNSGNDNTRTCFADLMIHKLCKTTNVITAEGFPVNVFINGTYWGIYNLRERVDRAFIADKRNWKKKKITILENGSGQLKAGREKDKKAYDEFMSNLPEEELISQAEFDSIAEVVSIKSFTDYILIETFFANQDWPANNVAWCRKKNKKWKWILCDLDLTMAYPGVSNVNANLLVDLLNGSTYTARLFQTLMKNEAYKTAFKERGAALIDNEFSEENIAAVYSKLYDVYRENIDMEVRRWRAIPSVERWELNCKENHEFLINRRAIFLSQLDEL